MKKFLALAAAAALVSTASADSYGAASLGLDPDPALASVNADGTVDSTVYYQTALWTFTGTAIIFLAADLLIRDFGGHNVSAGPVGAPSPNAVPEPSELIDWGIGAALAAGGSLLRRRLRR